MTANAAKQRWVGTIASDLWGFVRIKVRLRFVTATTAVGTLKCRRGSLRCIAKRGGFTADIAAGSFEAIITLANGVRCAAAGPATSSSMVGDYACLSGTRLVDAGVLVLNRRH